MIARFVYAAIVGIIVYLTALILLNALALPSSPWAVLLGVLAGLLTYFKASTL